MINSNLFLLLPLKLKKQFNNRNKRNINRGKAPGTPESGHSGKRVKYEIHHETPIDIHRGK